MDHRLACDGCYGENRAEKGNVIDRVDVFERMTRRNPFEIMTLRKDLNDAKREPVMCEEEILDKGQVQRP